MGLNASDIQPLRGPSAISLGSPSRDALQTIAEGVTQVAGFGVAAISVARDDGKLEVMAVAGSDEARDQLTGVRTPVASLMAELEKADEWGLLRFVPHERLELETGEAWGWVPDMVPADCPDAWHPLDLLIAPLLDDKGVLRGTLSIDLPYDGRRPGAEQRLVLEKYAAQAGRAVITALEREALAEQVRLADAARRIVRTASAQLSLERILSDCREALVEGFQALGMWIQTFPDEALGAGAIYSSNGSMQPLSDELVTIAETTARQAWEQQRVEVASLDAEALRILTPQQSDLVHDYLRTSGISSILFVPLGAGPECLGNLVLTRAEGSHEWTDVEAAAALDIGHDLGRAILNARSFEREHRLVEELQALDSYKSQLIATVSHELKNPLTAIVGHLEMLEHKPEVTPVVRRSLDVMERGARRLCRVIDDLLLLSKVGDPLTPVIAVPVDLHQILLEVVELSAVAAEAKGLRVSIESATTGLLALGDVDELDRVCANLVSNAVKYTEAGGTVRVGLSRQGSEIVLTCADEGLGISMADQRRLFTEFFRSTNPVAVAQPGTGLGLAIAARIVERHKGRIQVDSELGRGSTFRVFLPAAPNA